MNINPMVIATRLRDRPTWVIVLASIFSGLVATAAMDSGNFITTKLEFTYKVNHAFIGALTRGWMEGIIFYSSPSELLIMPQDLFAGFISHYVIGIIFAAPLCIATVKYYPQIHYIHALIYGALTSVVSLTLLFPAIGLGFAASKSMQPEFMVMSNIVNHFFYGVGLALSVHIIRKIYACSRM